MALSVMDADTNNPSTSIAEADVHFVAPTLTDDDDVAVDNDGRNMQQQQQQKQQQQQQQQQKQQQQQQQQQQQPRLHRNKQSSRPMELSATFSSNNDDMSSSDSNLLQKIAASRSHCKSALLQRLDGTYMIDTTHKQRVLLHGYLRIQIIKATNLRNMDGFRCLAAKARRHHNILCCRGCCAALPFSNDLSDPYVTVHAGSHRLVKTAIVWNNLSPVWNEEFVVPVAHYVDSLEFRVKDLDYNMTVELLGKTSLPVQDLLELDDDQDQLLRKGVHRVAPLDNKPRRHGWLEYAVEFVPAYSYMPRNNTTMAVPGTYFRPRLGCQHDVKLYINADSSRVSHNDNDNYCSHYNTPIVRYGQNNSKQWKPGRLWRDIYDSLCNAKTLIYIVGWSVDHTQSLLRGDEKHKALENARYSPYLGELLKQKANEGVTVNLLVWDDRTSNTWFSKNGIMSTRDEHLRLFCRDTNINLTMASIPGKHYNPFIAIRNSVTSTHHQKLIICDNGKQQLVGYIGGIDLTGGRYEDGTYPLFRSLTSTHSQDFYNGCATVPATTGPRQPWHDIHARVQGPVVLDLVQNFTERWHRQAPKELLDKLVDLAKAEMKIPDEDEDNDDVSANEESWSCQLFRSIDDRSAAFVPEKSKRPLTDFDKIPGVTIVQKDSSKERHRKRDKVLGKDPRPRFDRYFVADTTCIEGFEMKSCLNQKHGNSIDDSIQQALIHHIRQAEHCIYIESQYFLSSSHQWTKDSSTKCGNLVAAEITIKICQKIEAGKRFAAYVLLPMWSEGLPDSNAVQSILHWQHRTIEGIYKQIASAINNKKNKAKSKGEHFDAKPTDFLIFFCLGQRETQHGSEATGVPKSGTSEEVLSQTRRHLIYVHSKMTIIDDAVALIGSANLNQRSLDGCRDSEIMMSCWQPKYLTDQNSVARGEVHGFRLQCWAHNTGIMEASFRDPSSIECIRRMHEITEANWKQYTDQKVTDMKSHLLPYPITVDDSGKVTAKTTSGCFPDTSASILGADSFLPDYLTT